jgi:hypothetical protein
MLPGYGADRRELLAVSRGCRAKTDLPGAGRGSLAHSCEIAGGGSGSPILLLKDQAAVMIGIATAAPIVRPDLPVRGGIGVSATQFEQAVSTALHEDAMKAPKRAEPSGGAQNVAPPSVGADQTVNSRKAEARNKPQQPRTEVDDQKERDRKLNICRGC